MTSQQQKPQSLTCSGCSLLEIFITLDFETPHPPHSPLSWFLLSLLFSLLILLIWGFLEVSVPLSYMFSISDFMSWHIADSQICISDLFPVLRSWLHHSLPSKLNSLSSLTLTVLSIIFVSLLMLPITSPLSSYSLDCQFHLWNPLPFPLCPTCHHLNLVAYCL